MFWSIKSKRLDKLFPWRNNHVMDWELKWWQRPFINFCGWRATCNVAIQNLLGFIFCKRDKKHLWKNYSVWRDLGVFLLSLLCVFGWFFLIDVLIWKFRRRFNLMPKPVIRVPSKPTNFLGEVDIMSDEWDNFINNLTDAQGIELMRLFELHVKGEVCITKLENIVLKEESNGL